MAQCHAIIFVKPGSAFYEWLDVVDFVRRDQPPFLLAHDTERIVGKIPYPELRPCCIIPALARRTSTAIVEAAWIFVPVLVVITEAVGVRRRAAAVFAGSRDGFHCRLSP